MAQLSAVSALSGWAGKYPLAPRYGRRRRLRLTTADGVRLSAARLDGPVGCGLTVVLVHGFVNWSRTPAVHAFAHRLAEEVDVIVPDLRGHGRSGGSCTFGRDEPLDVAAAVAAADPTKPVVTVGISLGGASVLLHGGRFPGTVAGVVAVSPPAFWGGVGSPGADRIERWISTRRGRLVLRFLVRTRVSPDSRGASDAARMAAGIAPAFTIVASDPDDWYFGPEHAERIVEWAGQPKELWWCPGQGHGSDLLTTAFADRLLAALAARVGV